jgi:ferredoxin-NADP reductase
VRDEVEAACAAAGATLHTYLSRPAPGWRGLQGRITPAVLEALPGLTAPTFYLVGNGGMITELKRGLVERGVDRRKQIRTEAFFD